MVVEIAGDRGEQIFHQNPKAVPSHKKMSINQKEIQTKTQIRRKNTKFHWIPQKKDNF